MINSVRNSVLSVLNKNNYGYISPSDFNQYALNAQMEFFDEYFNSYNKSINAENARITGTDYADITKTISEVIESFLISKYLLPKPTPAGNINNSYYIPSLITTGDESYMINKVLCYTSMLALGTNTSISAFNLVNSATVSFLTLGISVGDIVLNITRKTSSTVASITNATTIALNNDLFFNVGDSYVILSASIYNEAEKVSTGKISLLNASLLTAPSIYYPAYNIIGNTMNLYPATIKGYGMVNATYFRYPYVPKWTYTTLIDGTPAFDQSQPDYQDFELPQEDEYKLVVKILEYCGISIREQEVVQFAMAQEQHEQPSFSQKQ